MTPVSTPSQQHNAIEAAVFALQLVQPVDLPAVQRINAAFEALGDELPGQQLSQGAGFQFGAAQQPMQFPIAIPELVRFRARPNGTHLWRVQVQGALISVTCHEYTEFEAVWTQAKHYLNLVLSNLAGPVMLVECIHHVLDQFNYDADPEDLPHYSLGELFQQDSPYLTPKAWDSGLLWHVYQGWFDRLGDGFKLLNQVNISNLRMDNGTRHATQIDHRIMARQETDVPFAMNDAALMDTIFRHLHASNMTMLRGLLNEQKQAEIGMRPAA